MSSNCTCRQWQTRIHCPIHGYIKPEPIHFDRVFLPTPRARLGTKEYDLEELLYAIIDRAEIGRGIAILEDEVDNFNWICQLAHQAIAKL